MADYASLQAAIDAGIDNMTVLRDNIANDGSTTTYAVDASWFTFNGVSISNIYSSGDSWIGFGTSSEHLRVNRRDCKVYYEYQETGKIGNTRFFKFKWKGTSYYSNGYKNNPSYQQYFDVWLFDNGQIFLNFYQVPAITGSGANALVCGSEAVAFSITAGTPCEYTFTPSDPAAGTGWSVEAGRPNLVVNYKTFGTAVFSTTDLRHVGNAVSTRIIWAEDTPEGTSLSVSAKLSGGQYAECANGGEIPSITPSVDLSDETLHIRVDMATSDPAQTPSLSQMMVELIGADDGKILVLNFSSGNQTSVQNASGPIKVAYNGATLAGEGGFVQAFELECPIDGLAYKGGQNDEEHVEIASIQVTGTLARIEYSDYSCGAEHIELTGITATGTLTHVDDI